MEKYMIYSEDDAKLEYWIRYSILVLFLSLFVFTMVTGKKLPILPLIFGIGIILTIFFPEKLWHRYLCPYGTIMSLPAKFSIFSMHIDTSICNNCSICSKICPTSAILKSDSQHKIVKNECLICHDCSTKCKKSAIKYQHIR
jgi:polyferredoxin